MKFAMHQNSLFAILLRSPWWASLAVAAGVVAALRLLLPDIYAIFAAAPFLVVAALAAWRQLRAPSAAKVAQRLEALRAQPWEAFARAVESAFRRDGYAVSRLDGREADFELTKGGRTSLVSCKRWKAARTGIEPLRELVAARRKREVHECIYIAAGEISANALTFSTQNGVKLLHGAELAKLLAP
ncbi:MAG TPA: restriction endonuclease [Burkholderiales bacterium]|nr:restriction endonuclease [Burkholderiales bacterium]